MSATFRTLFALWFGFALAAPVERACAQQGKDPPPKPSPLKMRFVAKQDSYVLDLGGKSAEEYRKMLDAIVPDKSTPPPGPNVDLALEITNPTDVDITIYIGGDNTRLSLDLDGPGAVSKVVTKMTTTDLKVSKPVVIAPGKTYSHPIKSLAFPWPRPTSQWYWTSPGDYTLTALWQTSTEKKDGKGPLLRAEPIKLRVTQAAKSGEPDKKGEPEKKKEVAKGEERARVRQLDVKLSAFPVAAVTEPIVRSSETELSIFDAKERDQIRKQVDFTKEKILWFGWLGQGSLAFDVKEDKGKVKVIFELQRPKDGAGDKARRGALIAVPRDAKFQFGKVGAAPPAPPPQPEPAPPLAAAGEKRQLRYFRVGSYLLNPRVPLAESPQGVAMVTLFAMVDAQGEGDGTLTLDPNRRTFNEFGDVGGATETKVIELACTLKFVKAGKGLPALPAPPEGTQGERKLYELRGKNITSPLSLMVPNNVYSTARLLIHDKDGKVAYVIELHTVEIPTNPCHPGCFPRGTLVETPAGLRPIETIRAGEVVLGVRPDGTTAPVKVQSIFTTPNRLVKVRTDGGIVFTTETQPLCLTDGRFRAARELQKGDRIWRWQDGKRQVVTVLDVTQTEREEPVHNLVLGDSEVFIAGGFLARSKPPVDAVTSRPALPLGQ
jgi:hypothetical protein